MANNALAFGAVSCVGIPKSSAPHGSLSLCSELASRKHFSKNYGQSLRQRWRGSFQPTFAARNSRDPPDSFRHFVCAAVDPYELQRSPEARQDLFNRIAPSYDLLNDLLSVGQHHLWKLQAVDATGIRPGSSCLDLCCGSGDLARLLAFKTGNKGEVFAVDFASSQLELARKKANDSFLISDVPMYFVQSDVLNLPFENSRFDCITMGYGLRNVTDIARSMKEILRVMRPSAKAAILDFNIPDNTLVRSFQELYLANLVVPMASLFGLGDEYAYINKSLEEFPKSDRLIELAKGVGFRDAVYQEIAFGMMGCLVLTK